MELSAYIRLARRWLWLILAFSVIAASSTYVMSRSQAPIYQATTTIQLGNYLGLTDPNTGMIQSAAALAPSYVALLKTRPILEMVIEKLKLPISPETLERIFDGRVEQGTSFLIVTVTYPDPVVASEVANELGEQLVANSPTELTKEQQDQIKILQDEVREAQSQLQKARDELAVIESAMAGDGLSDVDRAVLIERRAELTTEINATQGNLAMMTSSLVSIQQRGTINYIRVVEPARIPTRAFNADPMPNTIAAGALGAVVAYGLAMLLEYLNDGLRSPSEVMQFLSVPLLGSVAPFGSKRTYRNKLLTWTQPRSTTAEAYRALRVNMLYREDREDDGCRVYMITSSGPSEGKSVTVANLAVTFAATGMHVLVIDADVRRPSMHKIFNVPNNGGLVSILRTDDALPSRALAAASTRAAARAGEAATNEALRETVAAAFESVVQRTEIPGLFLLSAGMTPGNPASALDTPHLRELVSVLAESGHFDVILLDTPPVLVVTDTTIVAGLTDAKCLLVVESGRTRRGAAIRAIQQLNTVSVPVLGVFMNRLRAQDRDAGYGYYYYYGYTQYGPGQGQNVPPAPPQMGAGMNGINEGQPR